MAEAQEAKAQNPPTTIWNELDTWAQGFKPWQRFVLANAVRTGRLADEHVDQAYKLFLRDNSLGEIPSPPIDVPTTITGRPAEATPTPIWLKRIGDLCAVNALPATAELTFSPSLTVVYGGNGVGKSGFTRILSNVCFSRTQHPILPNVYDEEPRGSLAAKIVIADASQREISFVFDGSTERAELKRIAVFDTAVARRHLVEQSPFGFKPNGFDVFPEMARVYAHLANHLTTDIERLSRQNTLVNSFVAPESPVSGFVAALSADTDLVQLRKLAVFSETEMARLEEVQRQIRELQSKSVAEATKQIEDAKRDIAALHKRLDESRALLDEEKRASYREQLAVFVDKARTVAQHGAESFRQDSLKSVGTPEWEDFLAAARSLAQIERKDYPRDDDHCLLCHRPLDPASAALIRRFWNFLTSEARREVELASAELDHSVQTLKGLRLDFFSTDTTAWAHVTRLNPALAKQIELLVAAMEIDRTAIVMALEGAEAGIPLAAFESVDDALAALVTQIDSDIARLKEANVEDAIGALEAERVVLRHRQVLKQLLPEAEKYISQLVWAKKASGAPRRSLNPRPLTDKESELFATVIAKNYRDRFADECRTLDCNLPVEFRTQGQRGQTVRSLSIKGRHSPDAILSEGEQRAVALADFLTEIALNPANAGIVLDDPVTSQDHQRKDRIARRLVIESKNRQVIILGSIYLFDRMLGMV